MLFNTLFLSALASSTLASPIGYPQKDPACSFADVKCACPTGTKYFRVVSTAVYPIKPADITTITSTFFNTAWFGATPVKTEGSSQVVGAKRYFDSKLPEGSSTTLIYEQLDQFTKTADGGYTMEFGVPATPIISYPKTDGTQGHVAGTWEVVTVKAQGSGTLFTWNTHMCFSDADGEFESFSSSDKISY